MTFMCIAIYFIGECHSHSQVDQKIDIFAKMLVILVPYKIPILQKSQ